MLPLTRHAFLRGLAATAALGAVGCGDDSNDGGTGAGGTGGNSGGNAGNGGGAGAGGSSAGGAGGTAGAAGSATAGTGGSSVAGSGGTGAFDCSLQIDAQITCRHDHSLVIPAEHLALGEEQVYDIQGGNLTHGHDVTITAEMFAQLARGETVQVFVPSQFQTHNIYISCAGLDPHLRDEELCN